MNYGKKSTARKRNALISRSSMMGQRAHVSLIRLLFMGLITLCVSSYLCGDRLCPWSDRKCPRCRECRYHAPWLCHIPV